jgi:predicted RNase H-like HicB family nuclease
MKEQFTAVFQQVPEGYIGFVEELPGANTQGDTLDEARTNLQEAVQLVLESNRALAEESLRNKTVPRHREINDFLAQKICKDLEVPKP